MAEQTWEQRLRAAAEWLRGRHREATTNGRPVFVRLVMQGPGGYPVTIDAPVGPDSHVGRASPPFREGRHAAQLVAALVAAAPALADLLDAEADKQSIWVWVRAEVMPEFVIDPETARSASDSWIRQIVEAVERVRGVTA